MFRIGVLHLAASTGWLWLPGRSLAGDPCFYFMWPPQLDQGCYSEVTTELGLESDVWRASIGWGTCLCEVFVFLSAMRKGLREINETLKDGVVEHFSVSGAAFLENTLSLIYCVCITYSGFLTAFRQVVSPIVAAVSF